MAALVFAGFARDLKLKNTVNFVGTLRYGHVAPYVN